MNTLIDELDKINNAISNESGKLQFVGTFDIIKRKRKYIKNGQLHREDGPAVIQYYKRSRINNERRIKKEEYWINGEKHRIGDPAVIKYNKNKKINQEEFWENGKFIKIIRHMKTSQTLFSLIKFKNRAHK